MDKRLWKNELAISMHDGTFASIQSIVVAVVVHFHVNCSFDS